MIPTSNSSDGQQTDSAKETVSYVTSPITRFLEQIAFDGMRKHLMQDFTRIYTFDMGGNIRKNPKLSGTTHNVFGIQVGVAITLLDP